MAQRSFREFFNKCTFKKIAVGTSNWDYYTMQYQDNEPSVVSLAKENSGCADSCFGDIAYFFKMYVQSPQNYELTAYGEALLAEYLNIKKAI